MSLNDMKISTRLYVGFGIVLAVLIASVGLGVHRLQDVHHRFGQLANAPETQARTAASPTTASAGVTPSGNLDAGRAEAMAEAERVYATSVTLLVIFGAVGTLLGAAFAIVIARQLMRQLGGEPSHVKRVVDAIAAGDLSAEVATGADDHGSVLLAVKTMRDNLARIVGSVRQNSEGVATASSQIAQGNNDLSSRTEEQASALEETAASMEELNATVRQNADNAKQANQLASSASGVAVRGGEVVGQVVDTMKGINDSSKKIADIISVIDGIAFQTNILALNAAVEAARAGEQGRGFAVVATEVRNLAQRSAEAAKEIKTLINASVERVDQGTALVDQAGVTMTEIVASIRRVTDIMGEISAASTEQSAGVAQVGEAITQMDRATQQNAALVEESAAAAESLKSQAQELVQTVAAFKLLAGAGSGAVKAAAASTAPKKPAARPATKPAAERRSPTRAKNVVRPDFTAAAPKSAAAGTAPAPAATATASTGTDDWESF